MNKETIERDKEWLSFLQMNAERLIEEIKRLDKDNYDEYNYLDAQVNAYLKLFYTIGNGEYRALENCKEKGEELSESIYKKLLQANQITNGEEIGTN